MSGMPSGAGHGAGCELNVIGGRVHQASTAVPGRRGPSIFARRGSFAAMTDGDKDLMGRQGKCKVFLVIMREVLNGDPSSSKTATQFMHFISGVIVLSILVTCLETVHYLHDKQEAEGWFFILSTFTSVVFTLELVLRAVVSVINAEGNIVANPLKHLCTLLLDPLIWVDILALLPYYLGLSKGADRSTTDETKAIQSMRMLRLLRLFTIARHFEGAIVLWHALRRAAPVLKVCEWDDSIPNPFQPPPSLSRVPSSCMLTACSCVYILPRHTNLAIRCPCTS